MENTLQNRQPKAKKTRNGFLYWKEFQWLWNGDSNLLQFIMQNDKIIGQHRDEIDTVNAHTQKQKQKKNIFFK